MSYSYLTKHHFYDVEQLLEHLEVQPGQTVLDLGCGHHGYWSFPIAQKVGRTGEVHAVDIMRPAVDNIRKKSAELKLQHLKSMWADIENLKNVKLPLADLVLLVNTLNQIKDRKKALVSIEKLLRPQAKLLIIDWKVNNNPYGPPNESRLTDEEILKLSKRLNIEPAKDFILGEDHFGKLFFKV